MNPLYILLAILFFGVLIFIHELGHFIVARLCGVKILEFAIGMGPKLFSVRSKKSGTVYSLRMLPIGGFVSMLGENGMELAQGSGEETVADSEESDQNDSFFLNTERERDEEKPREMDPELAKHAYCNQNVWKRILISVAGPFMNVALGFLLMVVLVLCAGKSTLGSTQIAAFFVEYSAEETFEGLEKGDQIRFVDNERIRSMAQLREIVAAKQDGTFTVEVARVGEPSGVVFENFPLTTELLDTHFDYSLSEKSNLQPNDVVLKVNGTSVHTYNELYYEISNQGYRPLTLTVLRDGERVTLENMIFPSYAESGVTFGQPDFQVFAEAKFNFPTVVKHAFWRSCSTVKMVFDSIGGLFSGRYGVEAVSGPIGITQVISDAAKSSWLDVLNLLIVISINLGIMNLLPLPALDGGHILIYLIEVVRRKPMKRELEGIINFVGLVLLLGLAILISIKDVIAL